MNEVVVFRHQLFKVSEPFITQQAEQYKNYTPLYLGRDRYGEAPVESSSLALSDSPEQNRAGRRMWQVLTRDPHPYLKLIGSRRPALVHAHFGVEAVYALPLAHKLRVPLVTTFHGFDATLSSKSLLTSRSPSWINYALLRGQLARKGDVFLCVSEFIRQRVIELGFPAERTYVHHIGIDTESISPREKKDEKPLVLHVARLVEKKGTEYLIRAFSKIAHVFPEAELIIIGDGPLRMPLEALVRSLNIQRQVHFKGASSHADVMMTMRNAAMLALPSVTANSGDAEGLGMVLIEAAAFGVPVIGTQHGGIPEAIIDSQTGFIVAERDIDSLAEKIYILLADQEQRFIMGDKARAFCESHFDIRRQTQKLEAIYDQVLG